MKLNEYWLEIFWEKSGKYMELVSQEEADERAMEEIKLMMEDW